jgi:hypothetical protein
MFLLVSLSGCAAVAVVDTAVSVTATTVETAVDVTAGAVDLVIPDSDDDPDEDSAED